jgi:hypothetical protein
MQRRRAQLRVWPGSRSGLVGVRAPIAGCLHREQCECEMSVSQIDDVRFTATFHRFLTCEDDELLLPYEGRGQQEYAQEN